MSELDLNKKSKNVSLVLNIPHSTNYIEFNSVLDNFLRGLGCKYWYIYHDKDIKFVDGVKVPKTPHYHVILSFLDPKRYSTYLNLFRDIMPLNCVSLERVINLKACISYLIHFNDSDKYQYNKDSIITNSPEDITLALKSTNEFLSFSELYKICLESNGSRCAIMSKIGLEQYKYYRWLILDILTDLGSYGSDTIESLL